MSDKKANGARKIASSYVSATNCSRDQLADYEKTAFEKTRLVEAKGWGISPHSANCCQRRRSSKTKTAKEGSGLVCAASCSTPPTCMESNATLIGQFDRGPRDIPLPAACREYPDHGQGPSDHSRSLSATRPEPGDDDPNAASGG